jgi:hypothetical protein
MVYLGENPGLTGEIGSEATWYEGQGQIYRCDK